MAVVLSQDEIQELFRIKKEMADEYARTHDGWRAVDHIGMHIDDLYLSYDDPSEDDKEEETPLVLNRKEGQ